MASEDFALKTFLIFHIISQTNPGCGLIKDIIFNLILLFKIVSFFSHSWNILYFQIITEEVFLNLSSYHPIRALFNHKRHYFLT